MQVLIILFIIWAVVTVTRMSITNTKPPFPSLALLVCSFAVLMSMFALVAARLHASKSISCFSR
jgi:uncharacterized membrane protein YhaH (DUF805 family)